MRLRVEPGSVLEGVSRVPGDKSIAHRWLILAATASSTSAIRGLPDASDVRSTAACVGELASEGGSALCGWAARPTEGEPPGGSWSDPPSGSSGVELTVVGEGWGGLIEPSGPLDCGNSGTSMRLLSGLLAGRPFESTLTGDVSLSRRPMERVAEPLRLMGSSVRTTDGHAPLLIEGGALTGITYELPVPSAQVKSAVLFAGLVAEGNTIVVDPAGVRDHTERALTALGAPIESNGPRITVSAFQHEGFSGDVPGDPSSAAFLIAAAAITGSKLAVRDVGLNPTRTSYLDVMRRMGVHVREKERWESLGEPAGVLETEPGGSLRGTTVEADELPSIIDEVPVLAALASHAEGQTRFEGAGELRLKESDRLTAIVEGLRGLGGEAAIEGDALVVAGGGLTGGGATGAGDHRIAMALAVAAIGASADSYIEDIGWAGVSFPGFVETIVGLGARAEPA